MIYMWGIHGKPDPSFLCNGMLAGLVAITGSCAYVAPHSAVLIGAVAGVLVIRACFFIERRMKIDDPVGAISVHGVCGIWGVLAVGLFADGTYGTGGRVTGLLYGDSSQLIAQSIGIVANIIFVFGAGLIAFWVLEKVIGNRASAEAELQGLDIGEMGVLGYINEDPKVPEGHITYGGDEPKAARVPPDGHKRFAIQVEGWPSDKLARAWSELCKPSVHHTAEFIELYKSFTLLEGTRFRFISGNPEKVQSLLAHVLQSAAGEGVKISTHIEPSAERTPIWS